MRLAGGGNTDISDIGRVGHRAIDCSIGLDQAQGVQVEAHGCSSVSQGDADIAGGLNGPAAVGIGTGLVIAQAAHAQLPAGDGHGCVAADPLALVAGIQLRTGIQAAQQFDQRRIDDNVAVGFPGEHFHAGVDRQGIPRFEDHFRSCFDGCGGHIARTVGQSGMSAGDQFTAQGQIPSGIQLDALVGAADIDGHGVNINIPARGQRQRSGEGQGVL